MYFVISKKEYLNLLEKGLVSTRINTFWQEILHKLPVDLKAEAEKASFTLIPHPSLKDEKTKYSENLCYCAHNASVALQRQLESLENIVICMEDPL